MCFDLFCAPTEIPLSKPPEGPTCPRGTSQTLRNGPQVQPKIKVAEWLASELYPISFHQKKEKSTAMGTREIPEERSLRLARLARIREERMVAARRRGGGGGF